MHIAFSFVATKLTFFLLIDPGIESSGWIAGL